jgi:HEAT repeat protein
MNHRGLRQKNGLRATACLLVAGGMWLTAHGQTEWQELLKYDFGGCDAALTNIETQVRLAAPDQRAALEDKLLGVLASGEATFPAKQYACRMLKLIGSEKSVPALAKLLTDEKLAHAARYALEALPGKAAGTALRDALATSSGRVRIGLIGALGARRDGKAVATLAKLTGDTDAMTACAACTALGRIGNKEAAAALAAAKTAGAVEIARATASLICATCLAREGESKAAQKIFTALLDEKQAKQVRVGAFLGLVRLGPEKELPRVLAALKSDDPVLGQAVVPALLALAPKAVVPALTAELPTLPEAKKVLALNVLSAIPGVAPLGEKLTALINDPGAEVQLAAVNAAVHLGDGANVPALVAKLATDDDVGKAAKQTLTDMQGAGASDEIVKAAGAGDAKLRVSVIAILADRRDVKVLPSLYALLDDTNSKVRHAAAKSIGNLGEAADVAKLAGLIVAKKDAGDRDSLANALAAVASRQTDVATRAASIISGLASADDEAKVQLLGVLSALGGKPACEAVRGCLASPAPDVKKAAVKALAEWPDAGPLNDLLAVAKGDANDINRILALRGYIRVLALANMKADKRAQLYRDAMGMAQRTEEKRAVLAGLAQVQDVAAFKLIETYFHDESVKTEAFLATLQVADVLAKKKGRETKAALEVVIQEATDKNLKKRAQDAFNKIK